MDGATSCEAFLVVFTHEFNGKIHIV